MMLNVLFVLLALQGTIAAFIELEEVDAVDDNEDIPTNLEHLSEFRRFYADAFVLPKGYFSNWNPFSWSKYTEEESVEDKLKKLRKIQKILIELIKCGAVYDTRCEALMDKAESLLEDDNNKKKKKTQTPTTPRTTKASSTTTTTITTAQPITTTTETASTSSMQTTVADNIQNVTSVTTDTTTT